MAVTWSAMPYWLVCKNVNAPVLLPFMLSDRYFSTLPNLSQHCEVTGILARFLKIMARLKYKSLLQDPCDNNKLAIISLIIKRRNSTQRCS